MRIIIDVMGGDNAPDEILKGAFSAAGKYNIDLTLVGKAEAISGHTYLNRISPERIETVPVENVVRMDDDPLTAVHKKKDSSMMVALKLLADGKGDALVSAGNTGALFSGATIIVKRSPGIKRAAIGTMLPGTKPCLLLDAGANVTVTEDYLEQFAVIGALYMKKTYGIASPEVCILNNGTEDCKGTELLVNVGKRLRENPDVNFKGNVEASSVMFGACDVVVCDGFAGNIFLKATEGMGKFFLKSLDDLYGSGMLSKISYRLIHKRITKFNKRFDSSEHGGSPILGISKPVIKAHGSSDAKAFENAIYQAMRFAESGCGL
ncbi:MAG: phosphate acyltransferase PlsX [Lachnospiraceae bacterium]